jgi:hypothetical protein
MERFAKVRIVQDMSKEELQIVAIKMGKQIENMRKALEQRINPPVILKEDAYWARMEAIKETHSGYRRLFGRLYWRDQV